MKVTGYKLQHAIRELSHARDIAAMQFDNSLKAFPDEEKPHPEAAMRAFLDAEGTMARLQVVQGDYNLRVKVQVLSQRMPLSEAVKLVGGAGRAEKMWRGAAGTKKERYSYDRDERAEGTIVATRTISVETAAAEAKKAAKWASALREAIQVGNATEVEFDVDVTLFE